MRRTLIIACGAGLIACAIAFCGLTLAPQAAERHLRAAVIALLKKELTQHMGTELNDGGLLGRVQEHLRHQIDAHRAELEDPNTDLAAAVFARLCHYDCGTPAQVADSMRSGIRARVDRFEKAAQWVSGWATSRYSNVVTQFARELRIFTGSNTALLLLALIGLAKAPLHRGVQTVATLVMAATLTTAYFYGVHQNWLLTFVLADYVGWAYLAWVGLVFVFLIDVTFLRGRVTNAVLSALSPLSSAS